MAFNNVLNINEETMSDDDRDIDIESDADNDLDCRSNQKGNSSGYYSQAEKRAHHNALERKRRDHIKDSFFSLRDSVPSLQGEKLGPRAKSNSNASRAQILKKAAEYIQFMRRKNNSHQMDIDDLRRQNAILEAQIRAFERAKVTGNFLEAREMGLDTKSESDSQEDDDDDDYSSDGEDGTRHGVKRLKIRN